MHPVTQTVVVIAGLAVVAAAVLYVGSHVECHNFFGLIKGCATVK